VKRAALAGPLLATVAACAAAAPPAPEPPVTVAAPSASALAACPSAWAFVAHPTPSASPPSLPSPAFPVFPARVGDAYTVRGAIHDYRSRARSAEITKGPITVVGYVVKTNFADAPRCAIHAPGKADSADCTVVPLPTFALGDAKDSTDTIDVMGWAANWAQIHGLLSAIARAPKADRDDVKRVDDHWGIEMPNPLPSAGAKVRVTGTYGATFTKSSRGIAAAPRHGILTVTRIETLERAPEPAKLPSR
jgi:hypothetical protein